MSFFQQVYHLVKQIPYGRVVTYGQIAAKLGTPDARRAGHALHANRDKQIPCHRVVGKTGGLAVNFGMGGWQEQEKRLKKEGIFIKNKKVILKKHQFFFN